MGLGLGVRQAQIGQIQVMVSPPLGFAPVFLFGGCLSPGLSAHGSHLRVSKSSSFLVEVASCGVIMLSVRIVPASERGLSAWSSSSCCVSSSPAVPLRGLAMGVGVVPLRRRLAGCSSSEPVLLPSCSTESGLIEKLPSSLSSLWGGVVVGGGGVKHGVVSPGC